MRYTKLRKYEWNVFLGSREICKVGRPSPQCFIKIAAKHTRNNIFMMIKLDDEISVSGISMIRS